MTIKDLQPEEAVEQLSLRELEELAMKHMENDLHVVRHRGQVEVAREMRALATSNIADILYEDDDGVVRMRSLRDLPREVTASIKKIKIKRDRVKNGQARVINEDGTVEPTHVDMTGEVVEIELWDKNAPLDKLMRHYGGYAEDNKQLAAGGGANGGANLDLLLGAIGGQGIMPNQIQQQPPAMAAPVEEEPEYLEGEEDI